MTYCSSLALPNRSRWFVPLAGVITIIGGACTPSATTRVTQSSIAQQSTSTQVPGIPNRPELVTAIPFYTKPIKNFDTADHNIMIPAEVNGWRGIFQLDLGSVWLELNRTYLQPTPTRSIDSITDANRIPDDSAWTGVHVTLRIGTLLDQFEDPALSQQRRRIQDNRPINALLNHMWEAPHLTKTSALLDIMDMAGTLDSLVIAGRAFQNVRVEFIERNAWKDENASKNFPLLGTPFLYSLGVVGFNHRTRQFILYRHTKSST
jgi:hypothetical protein